MSEKMLLSFQSINLQFNFTGTTGAGGACPFATLGGLALRSFPVERLIQTAQITLGSSSVSFPISDILEATAFASYNAADYADTAASFERPPEEVGCAMGAHIGAGTGAAPANLLCAQTSSSTGSFILSGVPSAAQKGGSLNVEQISGGGLVAGAWPASTAVTTPVNVQVSMSGYLKIPILQWLAKECKESLSCLSQLQINLILNPVQNMVNYLEPEYHSANFGTLALQSINFDPSTFVSSRMTLSIRFITPPANYSMKDITRQYYQIDRYITTFASTINSATTASYAQQGTSISSNSFTLPAVPRFLLFFVKPSRNYYYSDINSVQVSNFYLPIVNLSLTIANRTAQLTSAPPEHLYSLAVESGLRAKYTQYRGYGGLLPSGNTITPQAFGNPGVSVVAAPLVSPTPGLSVPISYEPYAGAPLLIDVSTCLGLSEELCVGRNVPITLQATVQVVNNSGLQVNQCEFFVLAVTPAFLNIDHMNGNSVQVLGGVSAEEALQVASMDLGTIDNHHQTKFAGGFSFSDIVSKVKGALPMVKNIASKIASGLESAGYGTTGAGVMGAGMMHGEAMNNKKMAAVMKKMKMMAM